ncbi:MAG: S53 family peptidase [Terriglobales bacterium]|jgi:subtilase family serine protease
MSQDARRISPAAVVLACLAVLLIAVPGFAQSARSNRTLSNAQILGTEDPSQQITVTFWLNQHDKASFDELVRQMYDRSSPNYHHWLTLKEYQVRFAPRDGDMAVVRQHLATNNLHVIAADKLNHAITARGTVADVERATGVQLNRVLIDGVVHRLPSTKPVLSGAAGKLVYAVQGLSDTRYKSHVKRPINPDTGKPETAFPLSHVGPAQQYFNANCLRDTEAKDFRTAGGGPYAIYSGVRYGGPIVAGPPNLPPCGYDAPQVDKAYGLTSLYKAGLDGTGQTVVIVDAFGSDTITGDANAFAEINGLPALTSKNLTIYYPTGPTNCGGNTCGWDVETSLDVEWSHAAAPGASIALVLALDNQSSNLDLARLYAIDEGLGPVISNSYGIEEAYLATYDPDELVVENNINETGAALGISVNFSTGDDGDFLLAYGSTTVSMPASSPYATSVGGTSLFLNPDRSMKLQTGWGTNLSRIASYAPNPPIIPPDFEGFYFGAGGGTSAVWSKPSYQGSLSGAWRLLPDIAFLADPYTGVEVIDTENGQQFITVVGGTSLASPTFSGVWAIATQAAGKWLGQAAPILYGLPADAITDVIAQNGPNNVSGTTNSPPAPPVFYSPADLVAPVQNSTDFVSALYNGTSTRWYAISFGTDSSLTTGPGWDNVTGLGTPNGPSFVTAVAAAK